MTMWLKYPHLSGLTAEPGDVNPEHLLDTWGFLIAPGHVPLLATALGDLFLLAPDGRVLWLDVGAAELHEVATTIDTLAIALRDPERIEELFLPDLVQALVAQGHSFHTGQCFHATVPANLGGKYETSNYTVVDLVSHFRGMGEIQAQIINLPIGTEIHVKPEESEP